MVYRGVGVRTSSIKFTLAGTGLRTVAPIYTIVDSIYKERTRSIITKRYRLWRLKLERLRFSERFSL